MVLVSSFVERVQRLSSVMTAPTFESFVTVLTGWVFARRRIVIRMILAADAVPDGPWRIIAVNPTTGQRGGQAFYSTKTDDSGV